LRRPSLPLALAINHVVREADEWFDEPDDVNRVQQALAAIDDVDDPVAAAAVLAYRLTRAQAFGEGNKRTALLLARWLWTETVRTAMQSCRPTIGSGLTYSYGRPLAPTSKAS